MIGPGEFETLTRVRHERSRKNESQDLTGPFRFSPTLSLVLGCTRDVLQAWRLYESPTVPNAHHMLWVGLSRSGTRAATARKLENAITTVDLVAQSPPQFIGANVEIEGHQDSRRRHLRIPHRSRGGSPAPQDYDRRRYYNNILQCHTPPPRQLANFTTHATTQLSHFGDRFVLIKF